VNPPPPEAVNPFVLEAGAWAQPWRLWTCHLVHFGPWHALLNLAALAAPFAVLPRALRPRLVLGLALAAPLLSLALLPLIGDGTYRGASGLACTAWAAAGLALLRDRRPEALALLGLLGAKLAWEAFRGAPWMPGGEGWTALPAAHGIGALAGLGWGLVLAARGGPRR